jgi:hypothetical protein
MVDPARAVSIGPPYLHGMATVPNRVEQRRRAVQLARHYREAEGLSIAQIAQRLGRSPATIKAYFYDPTGEKAKAVKARYQGVCRGCGAPTQPRNGKGDAYASCKRFHPGARTPMDASACARRCERGMTDMARSRRRMTGHERMLTAAAVRRSLASAKATGPAPPQSPTSTPRGQPPATTHWGHDMTTVVDVAAACCARPRPATAVHSAGAQQTQRCLLKGPWIAYT